MHENIKHIQHQSEQHKKNVQHVREFLHQSICMLEFCMWMYVTTTKIIVKMCKHKRLKDTTEKKNWERAWGREYIVLILYQQ